MPRWPRTTFLDEWATNAGEASTAAGGGASQTMNSGRNTSGGATGCGDFEWPRSRSGLQRITYTTMTWGRSFWGRTPTGRTASVVSV